MEVVLKSLPLKFSGNAMNLRHTSFSWRQRCCSANANVVATLFMAMSSQSLASQSNLSLSRAYRSPAASRCWAIRVEAHLEVTPQSSSMPGSSSQYIKWSNTCRHPTHREKNNYNLARFAICLAILTKSTEPFVCMHCLVTYRGCNKIESGTPHPGLLMKLIFAPTPSPFSTR